MDNLKRIITALIGLPIVIAILVFGNKYVIDVVFAIIAEISIYEYFHAIRKEYKPVQFLRLYSSNFNSIYTYIAS